MSNDKLRELRQKRMRELRKQSDAVDQMIEIFYEDVEMEDDMIDTKDLIRELNVRNLNE